MIPLVAITAALDANLIVLRQGIALLGSLGGERYATRVPSCFNSAIGGHMRHVIEHYQGFAHGLDSGEIDYENRARDPLVEQDVAYATGILEGLVARLADERGRLVDGTLRMHMETSPGTVSVTSVLRELEFLLSHTIHHYALIAVMGRLLGVEPGLDFGMAPSTLKYQQGQAGNAVACAR